MMQPCDVCEFCDEWKVCVWVDGYVNKIDIEECNQEFYWKWPKHIFEQTPDFFWIFPPSLQLTIRPKPNVHCIELLYSSIANANKTQTNKQKYFIHFFCEDYLIFLVHQINNERKCKKFLLIFMLFCLPPLHCVNYHWSRFDHTHFNTHT